MIVYRTKTNYIRHRHNSFCWRVYIDSMTNIHTHCEITVTAPDNRTWIAMIPYDAVKDVITPYLEIKCERDGTPSLKTFRGIPTRYGHYFKSMNNPEQVYTMKITGDMLGRAKALMAELITNPETEKRYETIRAIQESLASARCEVQVQEGTLVPKLQEFGRPPSTQEGTLAMADD